MTSRKTALMLLFVTMALLGVCSGASSTEAVHKGGVVLHVGDSTGWSILGDYEKWASSKEFHVGDTLLFSYNKEFNDLMEVTEQDYKSCNNKSPLALHAAGLDAIPLDKAGDYYFICGRNFEPDWYALTLKQPGLCHAGQKLHVKVTLPRSDHPFAAASPSSTPAPAPAPAPK